MHARGTGLAMTTHKLSNAFRIRRALPQALRPSSVATKPREPMDETTLASEIARIMERPSKGCPASLMQANQRWLGDEADRAIVEAYENQARACEPAQDARSAGDAILSGTDGLDPSNETRKAYSPETAARWVRQARRDRFRTKLRDATGWAVSVTVSLILVVSVGIAMYGWSSTDNPIRQLRVKPVNVSGALPPKDTATTRLDGPSDQAAPLVSAGLEAPARE